MWRVCLECFPLPRGWAKFNFNVTGIIGTREASMSVTRKMVLLSIHTLRGIASYEWLCVLELLLALQCAVFGQTVVSDAEQQRMIGLCKQLEARVTKVHTPTGLTKSGRPRKKKWLFDLTNVHALMELLVRDIPTFGSAAPLRMNVFEAQHKRVKQHLRATNQRRQTLQVMQHFTLQWALEYMMDGGCWGAALQYQASPAAREFWTKSGYGARLIYDLSVRI